MAICGSDLWICFRALGADNLCQISSGNVIAFSASGGPEEGLNVAARGYHVFVADLNTPWDIHLLVGSDEHINLGHTCVRSPPL